MQGIGSDGSTDENSGRDIMNNPACPYFSPPLVPRSLQERLELTQGLGNDLA